MVRIIESNVSFKLIKRLLTRQRKIMCIASTAYRPIQEEAPPEFCMGVQIGEERPHSYHTLRSSTRLTVVRRERMRHIISLNMGDLGVSFLYYLHTLTVITSPLLTLSGLASGMKRGNQLNIPGECD